MSVSFEINASAGAYQVVIGNDDAAQTAFDIRIVDAALPALWPLLARADNIEIPATEETKTLETVAQVIEKMRDLGANRATRMAAFGGGIIQDVSTFCASTYMRGVQWTYYPTTLLGMVDSCIGGKSSINVGQYKNIAGNYYPPQKVIIDPRFCSTLEPSDTIAGLCEAVKICFASRDTAFDRYLALVGSTGMPHHGDLAPIIELSLRTKKVFIEEDEFDQGPRLLLNFGHTFGHALEAASQFEIGHGVAVGLGMLLAIKVSFALKLSDRDNPRAAALAAQVRALLAQVPQLGEKLGRVSSALALKKFKSDKKHRNGEYAMILIDGDGYLRRHFVVADSVADTLLLAAFDDIKDFS